MPMSAQNNRSMRLEAVAYRLGMQLQNNSQDSEYQRNAQFQITVGNANIIKLERTWTKKNGEQDQMVLWFNPLDIIDVDLKYQKHGIALSIRCTEKTVSHFWLNGFYENGCIFIEGLKEDTVAIDQIRQTLTELKALAKE